ncbi:MAG: cytochrome-c peroxidase [Candidatus Sericytochromatia bacterium]|nr:cytochrome-c peroxidase [Candidatus Sericytochromatia bacterium]
MHRNTHWLAVLAPMFLIGGTVGVATRAIAAGDDLQVRAQAAFKPIDRPAPNKAVRVELGRQLYHDPRLSRSGAISCASCHNLASGGVDNRETSLGHKAQVGGRNAPTTLNASVHLAQFWDGRAKDLTEQAKGPILNPGEMALPSEAEAVKIIRSVPGYQKAFKAAFPGSGVTYQNIAVAIADFEKTLVTPSRFDDYLRGRKDALSTAEKKGLKTFMDKGCVTCHSGVGVGGGMYMKFGMVAPYKHQADEGRFAITKDPADKFVFKVPSLRNVQKTYPYFHDGKVWSLDEAVAIMGKTQLGVDLSGEERASIVAFLKALDGDLPPQAMRIPELPVSGPDTPRPSL